MTVTTGRTLDGAGRPVPGTGFEVDPDGELGDLLAGRTGPLNSHPTQPVWGAPLDADGDTLRSVTVLGPGYDGPPEHYHERSVERFEVLAGEPTFHVDGAERRGRPGETVTVETGERHTFSVDDGAGRSYMITEIHSPGRLRQVLPTLGGIAHDEGMDPDDPLQRVAIARRLAGNTTFTDPDPRLARPLTRALAPLARLGGYRGAYAKYSQPAFWEAHVEQPEF
jgi:mannose-6-phosphate isomerase-like protein (cupin superfamily)